MVGAGDRRSEAHASGRQQLHPDARPGESLKRPHSLERSHAAARDQHQRPPGRLRHGDPDNRRPTHRFPPASAARQSTDGEPAARVSGGQSAPQSHHATERHRKRTAESIAGVDNQHAAGIDVGDVRAVARVLHLDDLGTLTVAVATSLLDSNAWRTRMAYVPWRLQERFTIADSSAARRTSRSHSAQRAGRTRKALPPWAGDSVANRSSSPDPNGPREEELRPRFDR
jgi:hypothetical protein